MACDTQLIPVLDWYNLLGDAGVDPDEEDLAVASPAPSAPPVQIGDTRISVSNLAAYINNKMKEPDPFKSEYIVCSHCLLTLPYTSQTIRSVPWKACLPTVLHVDSVPHIYLYLYVFVVVYCSHCQKICIIHV